MYPLPFSSDELSHPLADLGELAAVGVLAAGTMDDAYALHPLVVQEPLPVQPEDLAKHVGVAAVGLVLGCSSGWTKNTWRQPYSGSIFNSQSLKPQALQNHSLSGGRREWCWRRSGALRLGRLGVLRRGGSQHSRLSRPACFTAPTSGAGSRRFPSILAGGGNDDARGVPCLTGRRGRGEVVKK